MSQPITAPKGPYYDLRLDPENDTLQRHARELQPGGYYHFHLVPGDWTGHIENLRACLPKGVVLRSPFNPPDEGKQLYFFKNAEANDGITSAQTPRSLKSLLPGFRAPAWLRRFLRNRKVAAEAAEAACKARLDSFSAALSAQRLNESRNALRTTIAKEALVAMLQHGTTVGKPHYRNPATGVVRHYDTYKTTDADVERWKAEGFVYLPDAKVLSLVAVEHANNLIAELDRPPAS